MEIMYEILYFIGGFMFKKDFLKKFLILITLFIFYIFILATYYADAIFSDISESVLRLHVIANSDSQEDQNLKYIVRDNVLKYMNEISLDCESKEEAIKILTEHLDDFRNIALSTIKENGFDYDVSVSIDNCAFPTKTYGDISLPAGYYDALRIKIGNADGQNWWCVMFPPLCFVDVSSGIVDDSSKELMEINLSEEEYHIISDNSTDVKVKFKIIEWLNNIK